MASGNIIVIKPDSDFEMVGVEIIRNYDLETIGLYCKLLLLGATWTLNVKGLAKKLAVSPRKVRKAFGDLETGGFIVRKPHYEMDKHKLTGWNYYVYGHSVGEDERSKAGLSLSSVTQNQTTPEAVNTGNGKDIIYRLKSNNRLINSDRLKSNNRLINSDRLKDNMVKPFNFRESLIEIGVSEDVADAYMQVRKMKRAANTEIAFNALRREINKSGKTANDCVTVCVENSWSGFKAEWLNKPRQSSEANQPKNWYHNNIEVGKRLGIIPQDYGK